MSDPAGRLQIRIGPSRTSIDSTRPVQAARVLAGRSPDETLRLLPGLFSICATAQSAACVGALEGALGLECAPEVLGARRRLVHTETLREHLWRVLLDWPRYLGLAPDAAAMARVMAGYGRLRAVLGSGGNPFELGAGVADGPVADRPLAELGALVEERILGLAPHEWVDAVYTTDRLFAWGDRTDTVAARLLRELRDRGLADLGRASIGALPGPGLDPLGLDARLGGPAADDFVARPTWDGAPREASALTRHLEAPLIQDLAGRFGNGILTRLVAQLLEVARILCAETGAAHVSPSLPATRLAAGVGLAQVPAARGLLIHRVEVTAGRVWDYRILAPTEWNFHPQGVVATGLDGLRACLTGSALESLARLFITAVDPCVDFELTLD